ncbi:glutamine--fructose-6-phosphate transaminase (isomerizing) [Candidatus Dojkabacteria bacterium]|nr:glutamine--fructose-6-phosphate transaminase (isomerizing) [Candidatus Dojkabacteria bacterium]
MCGVFGYVGKSGAAGKIVNGLKRLEYRGYDSWGIAVVKEGEIEVTKKVGAIGDLDVGEWPESHIGVGHTRWATHGGVTEVNAHPHFSTDKSFVLAQNGIVENYQDLKKNLINEDFEFISETDTEVIVRLVEDKLKSVSDLREAVRLAFLDLEGRNTIVVLSSKIDHVIAVRNGSPLVVGVGSGEYFFASDTLSFADKTSRVVFINDGEIVEYKDGEISVFDAESGKKIDFTIEELENLDVDVDKSGYDHFMLKEIVEQKDTVRSAVQYSMKELEPLIGTVKKSSTVYTIGAGTASYEAGQAAYFLRKIAGVKAVELKSYEVDSYRDLFSPNDLIIAYSQSGETADTVEAVEFAISRGAKVASIVNMLGSTLTRISDMPFFVRSGPEICVCSTKAFSAKLSWSLLVSCAIAGKYDEAKKSIYCLSDMLQSYFSDKLFERIRDLSRKLKKSDHAFILGRGQNYYITLESALKIKEISYLHAEGFAGGELKHGVIALIEKGTPVFVLIGKDEEKENIISAAAEVKARGAWLIGVGQVENELFDEFIATPDVGVASCISNVIPFQLVSYFLALELGYDPDKPRNLAKSVTVK